MKKHLTFGLALTTTLLCCADLQARVRTTAFGAPETTFELAQADSGEFTPNAPTSSRAASTRAPILTGPDVYDPTAGRQVNPIKMIRDVRRKDEPNPLPAGNGNQEIVTLPPRSSAPPSPDVAVTSAPTTPTPSPYVTKKEPTTFPAAGTVPPSSSRLPKPRVTTTPPPAPRLSTPAPSTTTVSKPTSSVPPKPSTTTRATTTSKSKSSSSRPQPIALPAAPASSQPKTLPTASKPTPKQSPVSSAPKATTSKTPSVMPNTKAERDASKQRLPVTALPKPDADAKAEDEEKTSIGGLLDDLAREIGLKKEGSEKADAGKAKPSKKADAKDKDAETSSKEPTAEEIARMERMYNKGELVEKDFVMSLLEDIINNPQRYIFKGAYLPEEGPLPLRFAQPEGTFDRNTLIPVTINNDYVVNIAEMPLEQPAPVEPVKVRPQGDVPIGKPAYEPPNDYTADEISRLLQEDAEDMQNIDVDFQVPYLNRSKPIAAPR